MMNTLYVLRCALRYTFFLVFSGVITSKIVNNAKKNESF